MKRFLRQTHSLLSTPLRNKISFNLLEGTKTHIVEVEQGRNLMRTLSKVVNKDLEDDVFGICGGNLDCGSCMVIVKDYSLTGKPEDDELTLLKGQKDYVENRARCSCQLYAEEKLRGATIELTKSVVDERAKQIN